MRLARLVAAGLMLGAAAGFVAELLRPRRDPRVVPASTAASAGRPGYAAHEAVGRMTVASAAPLIGGPPLTRTGGTL